jgi:glycosyltransferase involved in cell wall biosynthesis
MSRNVVIIANEFPPIGGAGILRYFFFSKYLPDFGWYPSVVTVKEVVAPTHDYTLLPQLSRKVQVFPTESFELRRILWWLGQVRARLGLRNNNEVKPGKAAQTVVSGRFRETGRGFRKWLFIPDDRMLWAPFAIRESLRLARKIKPDLILATAPPYSAGVIGYVASRLSGIPMAMDLRDPWSQDPYFQGPTPFHRWLNRKLESIALNHATKIIVISNEMKRNLLHRYTRFLPDKVTVITNGYDADEFSHIQPYKYPDKFVFAYIGSLYAHHRAAFRSFCVAWTALCDESPEFESNSSFWAIGRCDPEIMQELSTWPRIKAKMLGYQSHSDSMRFLVSASALLLLIKNLDPREEVITIPGKLFEYIASERPILMIGPDGDAAEAVRLSNGSVYQEDDIPGIVECLRKLYHAIQNGENRNSLNKGNVAFERKHLTSCLAHEFNSIVDPVVDLATSDTETVHKKVRKGI